MHEKRNKLKIIYDILKVIQDDEGRIKPTQILYRSNLSHEMLENYLKELFSKEFIKEQKTKKGGKTYILTQRGYDYINKYSIIINFVETFGLAEQME